MYISSQVGVRVHSLLLMHTTLTISQCNRTRQASVYAQMAKSLILDSYAYLKYSYLVSEGFCQGNHREITEYDVWRSVQRYCGR